MIHLGRKIRGQAVKLRLGNPQTGFEGFFPERLGWLFRHPSAKIFRVNINDVLVGLRREALPQVLREIVGRSEALR